MSLLRRFRAWRAERERVRAELAAAFGIGQRVLLDQKAEGPYDVVASEESTASPTPRSADCRSRRSRGIR